MLKFLAPWGGRGGGRGHTANSLEGGREKRGEDTRLFAPDDADREQCCE